MKGGIDDSAKDLSPDTEYIVYAYGMDSTGRILTGMYYAETATLPPACTMRRQPPFR